MQTFIGTLCQENLLDFVNIQLMLNYKCPLSWWRKEQNKFPTLVTFLIPHVSYVEMVCPCSVLG
jgi:hypothetical protein